MNRVIQAGVGLFVLAVAVFAIAKSNGLTAQIPWFGKPVTMPNTMVSPTMPQPSAPLPAPTPPSINPGSLGTIPVPSVPRVIPLTIQAIWDLIAIKREECFGVCRAALNRCTERVTDTFNECYEAATAREEDTREDAINVCLNDFLSRITGCNEEMEACFDSCEETLEPSFGGPMG